MYRNQELYGSESGSKVVSQGEFPSLSTSLHKNLDLHSLSHFKNILDVLEFSSAIGKRQGYGKRDVTVLIPLQISQQSGPSPTVIIAAGLQTPKNIPRQTPIPLPERHLEPPHSPVSGLSQRAVGGSHSPQKSQGTQSLL